MYPSMKLKLILFFFLILACGKIEQPINPTSFDGKYRIENSVSENGILLLHIISQTNEEKIVNTNASIYQKFAVGWLNRENTIILYSADLGVFGWSASDNFTSKFQIDSLESFARSLYEQKYHSGT